MNAALCFQYGILMENLINCSDYESARISICNLYEIPVEFLDDYFRSSDEYNEEHVNREFVFHQFTNQFGALTKDFNAVWFHGTRVDNIQKFYEDGILPKSKMRERLQKLLYELSSGMKKEGTYPNMLSFSSKQNENDEGPFAFLIKDAVEHSPGAAHSYIDAPEIVEDIAGLLLGKNYRSLVDAYKSKTMPYVVSFVDSADDFELKHAIWYIYLNSKSINVFEEGAIERCYFNARNRTIHPSKIINIEEVKIA